MEHARPPLLHVVLAVLISLVARPAADRKPAITLTGETSGPFFGEAIAADGPVLAVIDGSPECTQRGSPCRALLRIERLVGVTTVPEARIGLERSDHLPHIALRGNLAASYYSRGSLDVFRRDISTWTRIAQVEAPAACTSSLWAKVHIGDGFIALDTYTATCILVPLRGSWDLEQIIPHATSVSTTVFGDAVFMVSSTGVAAYQRSAGVWKSTPVVQRASSQPRRIAVSERWLVIAETSGNLVEVFDRHRGYALHATLFSRYAWSVSVSPDTLVTTGHGSRTWHFDGTSWSGQADLEHWERGGGSGNAIGTRIWIGDPGVERGQVGYVRAYELQ